MQGQLGVGHWRSLVYIAGHWGSLMDIGAVDIGFEAQRLDKCIFIMTTYQADVYSKSENNSKTRNR